MVQAIRLAVAAAAISVAAAAELRGSARQLELESCIPLIDACPKGYFCKKANPYVGTCTKQSGPGEKCNLHVTNLERKHECQDGLFCRDDGFFFDDGQCEPYGDQGAACETGSCKPGLFCNENTDKCDTMKPNGASCTHDSGCQSGDCGHAYAGASSPVCCSSGNTLYAGYDYCTEMADGTACWSDDMCASGHCDDNMGGLKKGVCKTKAANGETCTADSGCQSGDCGYAYAGASSQVCCSSGNILYAGYDYCTDMPDNSACWSDAMCASGHCAGNMSGLKKGVCKSKAAAWASCSSNSDCLSGDCARTTRYGNFQCCPNGSYYCYAWTSGDCKANTWVCKGKLGH